MKSYRIALTLFAASLSSILAVVPSAIFHAEFDQDFNAVTTNGTAQGKHSREILWESLQAYIKEGVVGKAAVVGVDENKNGINIIYKNNGHIDINKGSVVFWFMPIDWEGSDGDFHVFFRAWGKDASMICYKTPEKRLLFLLGPERLVDGKKIWTQASAPATDLKPGKWYFFSATWDNEEITLYLNGRQLDKKKLIAAPGDFSHFGIGGRFPEKWVHPHGTTLMDEVMLYNVPLTPGHVRARFSSYNRSIVEDESVSPDPAKVVTLVDEKKGIINLRFVENRAQKDGTPFKVTIEFTKDDGSVFWSGASTSEIPLHSVEIPMGKIAPGAYKISLKAVAKDGTVAGKTDFDFLMSDRHEPWRKVATADDDSLPTPWTPVSYSDSTFSCWNRTLEFNGSLLPTQIISGDAKLLETPVSLLCDGKPLPLDGTFKCVHRSDASVKLEGKNEGRIFNVDNKALCEFDGFVWFDLTLTPSAKTDVESLTMDFTFTKEASTLFNAMHKQYMDFKPGDYGNFKDYGMDLFGGNKIIFVGNDSIGLEWFCETLEDWDVNNKNKTLQLIRQDNCNILRLNMIDHKVTLESPLVFRFGIQALPVRPMTPNWRLVRLARGEKNSFNAFWKFATRHNSLYKGHVRTDYKEDKALQLTRYSRIFEYTAGFTMSPLVPEWPYHCLEWSKTPPALGFYGAENNPQEFFAWVCPKSESMRNYYTYHLRERVNELDIKDLYVDNQDAQPCMNEYHGCGFTAKDGKRYPSFNILSTRDLTKRIYKIIREHNSEGQVFRHMSQKPYMPALSFSDYLCDGECYNKTVAEDESYLNILDPSLMRACYRSLPYGIPNYFIPQFQRAIRFHSPIKNRFPDAWQKPEDMAKHEPVLRHFLGYFLVHDAQIWPSFGISLKKWWRIQDVCGFDGNERFVLYADDACPFQSAGRFMVSCYVLNNGRSIIVAMNDTDKPIQSFKYDAAKMSALGVTDLSLTNLESGEAATTANGVINSTIPPRDYILLGNFEMPKAK